MLFLPDAKLFTQVTVPLLVNLVNDLILMIILVFPVEYHFLVEPISSVPINKACHERVWYVNLFD